MQNTPWEASAFVPVSVLTRVMGVTAATAYRAIKRAHIPLAPLGGKMRIRTSELEAILGRALRPSDIPERKIRSDRKARPTSDFVEAA
jgi:hypothetical protein